MKNNKILLSRDNFRSLVFKRDKDSCVYCGDKAQDAHHILERRLFNDGGYYLNNGASLCSECHILAENTKITPDDLRSRIGITEAIVPDGLSENARYDKWAGNSCQII